MSEAELPVGTVIPWLAAGTNPTPPPGWLLCNRGAVSRSTYAALFAAIGTTYGSGDGSTTFNLPGGQGRFMWASSDAWGGTNSHSSVSGLNNTNQIGGALHSSNTSVSANLASTPSSPEGGEHGHSFNSSSVNTGALPNATDNIGSHGGATGTSGASSSNVNRDTGNTNYLARTDHGHNWSTGAIGHGAHAATDHTINSPSVGTVGAHNHNAATLTLPISANSATTTPPHVALHHLIRY